MEDSKFSDNEQLALDLKNAEIPQNKGNVLSFESGKTERTKLEIIERLRESRIFS